MKRTYVYMVLLFALTGCLEDKEAILADCRLKYANKSPSDPGADVLLCMKANGYEFAEVYTDTQMTANSQCWDTTHRGDSKKDDPITEFYTKVSCYKSRSVFYNWH